MFSLTHPIKGGFQWFHDAWPSPTLTLVAGSYLAELKANCDARDSDFKQRSQMREDETKAIAQAIKVMKEKAGQIHRFDSLIFAWLSFFLWIEKSVNAKLNLRVLISRNFEKPPWNWDNGSLKDLLDLVRSVFGVVIQQTFGEAGICYQIPMINLIRHQFQKHWHPPCFVWKFSKGKDYIKNPSPTKRLSRLGMKIISICPSILFVWS